MNYQVIEKDHKKYVRWAGTKALVSTEKDALSLCVACMESKTNLLMLDAKALSEDFFLLRTGLAGQVLQKFTNYQVKAALIITKDQILNVRFKELLSELNKGNDFRTFTSTADAENWLLKWYLEGR
jgi:PadR family transcriptional regulator, regulatory protein AphA